MSQLACAACGAEDQIATVVLPAGTNAATEALAGLVERVTFHNEENGFCVLRVKARGQRDLITVLGHAAMISAGEFVPATRSCRSKTTTTRKSTTAISVWRRASIWRRRAPGRV